MFSFLLNFLKYVIRTKFITDRCPLCKKPRKKITKGIDICDDPSKLKEVISIFGQKNHQTVTTERLANEELTGILIQSRPKVFFLNVSEKDMVLGGELKYKRIVKEYKLLEVDELREITMKNKIQFRKDRKKWERNEKERNGYG